MKIDDETIVTGIINRALKLETPSCCIRVACLDDLINMKKQAGRGRDLLDVEALEKIREFNEQTARK